MPNHEKDLKFRLKKLDYDKFKFKTALLKKKHGTKFNQSRFFRLCADKVDDETFLEFIGYREKDVPLSHILFPNRWFCYTAFTS